MNENETTENKRKRLIFRSGHRGTKEMDLLMGSFALQYVPEMSEDDLTIYDAILEENDPDLYNWITGKEDAPANLQSSLFEKLKNHTYR